MDTGMVPDWRFNMDATLAKLIQSRAKSVEAQKVRVADLEKLRAATGSPAAAVVLDQQLQVARQRLAKLRQELAGLEAAVEPGLPDAPPRKR